MAFQRSYSKVWWGSDNQLPSSSYGSSVGSSLTSGGFYYSTIHNSAGSQQPQCQSFGGSGYHSLDYNSLRMYSGNLSRIQEVDDEQQNSSKISWGKRESPGSLRSQDSGFSDNDESHSTRSLGGHSSKTASPGAKLNASRKSCDSPASASTHTIATPPTVIRRVGRSEFYSPLVSVSRRISFSGSPAATASGGRENVEMNVANNAIEDIDGSTLLEQLDSIQLLNSTPKHVNANDVLAADDHNNNDDSFETATDRIKMKSKIKRRRRIVRTPTKKFSTPIKRRTLQKETNDDDAANKCFNRDIDNDGNANDYDDDDDDDNDDGDDDGDDNDVSSFDDLEQELAEMQRNVPEYNNETVYIGAIGSTPAYNNETVILGGQPEDRNNNTLKAEDVTLDETENQKQPNYQHHQQLLQQQHQRTSTPKLERQNSKSSRNMSSDKAPSMDFLIFEPITAHYTNPLLNGHTPALQHWLYELQSSCEQEVMSTLQTKSIAQEAFKNLTITTNTVAKLIRQLQQRAHYMQSDFERIERLLSGQSGAYDALSSAEQLLANISEFTNVLERRSVFFSESRAERKKYDDNLDQIKLITKDTRYSLERQHYINLDSLLDDIQVLKRYLLIALRQVFERMVRIIVHSIEQSRCDLMLRANINMVSTLTNIDYEGFASLTDAFVHNEAVRALLIVCLGHKLSSVRALALRALATICSAPAAIAQLCASDGIEILRDILQFPLQSDRKRSPTERREAVSLLTQLTAAWHGPEHRVEGLKDCVESIVAGLTQLVGESTNCSQTLLLCAAALNNLSRMEVTSHYSIMSNETVFKLIDTVEAKQQQQVEGISVFLYEQIVSMLYNMSLNKKCHSHLANGCIINFITCVYEMEFYRTYDSRAESDAQRRAIKAILHTLTRLIQDSNGGSLGLELYQQQRVPAMLLKLVNTSHSDGHADRGDHTPRATYEGCHQLGRDIELLVRQLEMAQKQAQEQRCQFAGYSTSGGQGPDDGTNGDAKEDNEDVSHASKNTSGGGAARALKLNLTKQESFV